MESHESMPFAWLIRGDALMAQGKARKAAETWRRAAELDTTGDVSRIASDRLEQLSAAANSDAADDCEDT